MTLKEFLSDRLGRLILWLVSIVAMATFLLSTGTQKGILVILLIAVCILFITVQAIDFYKCKAYLRELESIMNQLDQKHLFAECVPKPQGIYEQRLFALIRRSGKAMIESVSEAQASQYAYREYIESWVHEIKTPITGAQLICRNAEPEIRRKLLGELAQIDNHVERALFYARAESPEKDFIIRQVKLVEIVTQAIERHRTLLIQYGVRVSAEDLECTVYTDDKWVAFMLGQLLQNAVRYGSKNPVITISAQELGKQVQLTVEDNGIGIPPHEISRIFQRGFTGSNGRSRGGATGMGLYLCQQLSNFLQINLQVQSEEGKGTKIILTFPAKENLAKM